MICPHSFYLSFSKQWRRCGASRAPCRCCFCVPPHAARPVLLRRRPSPPPVPLSSPNPPANPQADIPSVSAIILLDGDGKRVVVRYYKSNFASSTEELAFEKKLFDKTLRTNAKAEAEIIILDGLVSVYRNSSDLWMYVVGTQSENELILATVLTALHDALLSLLRGTPDKRLALDNYDTLLVTIDEMIDAGMILETDAAAIVNRVGMKAADAAGPAEGTFTEGNLNSMFAGAREQLAKALLK
jgi:hypothetical protein